MRVYGLSGKSGTGKSYMSGDLCARYNIRGLIDDGLFMYDGNIIAGTSAKKQSTMMGAIKTALFTKDQHCFEVRDAIKNIAPEAVMVLGTSDRMVLQICERLELSEPGEIIHIEDVTTEEQREKASRFRKEGGMHIIPAPTLQVKKQFSGYFLDPRRSFGKDAAIEKTIVRPTYSYLGDYTISEQVIHELVRHLVAQTPGIDSELWTAFSNDEGGCIVRTVVLVKKSAKYRQAAETLQANIYEMVSHMTAFNIRGIEVEIRGFR
jgi:uncharacterized alkaline shock family protein YloU